MGLQHAIAEFPQAVDRMGADVVIVLDHEDRLRRPFGQSQRGHLFGIDIGCRGAG